MTSHQKVIYTSTLYIYVYIQMIINLKKACDDKASNASHKSHAIKNNK